MTTSTDKRRESLKKSYKKQYQDKKRFTMWMSPEEYAGLQAAATAEGLSMAEFVRRRCLSPDHTGD